VTLRRLWLAAGCAFVAAVVWISVTPSPPELEVTQGDKVGHVLAYALLMFWFCQLHAARAARVAYAAGFLALGIGLEFVQGALGYRSLEGWDVLADAIGVAAGWLGATFFRPGILERFPHR
jgi:VanZ family protein